MVMICVQTSQGQALALLRRHIDAYHNSDSATTHTYNHIIPLLGLCFRNTIPGSGNHMVVWCCLAMVPDTYPASLQAHSPLTKVCDTYLAVLLHGL